MRSGLLLVAAALLLLTSALQGQANTGGLRVHLGVEPASVTVGEPFRTAIRVDAPAGMRVEYGEMESSDSLQSIAPVTMAATRDGSGEAAVYTLVAWVAGTLPNAIVTVRVTDPAGDETSHTAELALPQVVSVLPEPGEPVEPRPVKGTVGRVVLDRLPWWWLAVILAAILAAILAYRRLRRGDGGDEAIPARDWALAQLASIELERTGTAAEVEEVYRRTSWVLRGYLARIDPRLGPELTTSEIGDAIREAGAPSSAGRSLVTLLETADRVKFAGRGAAVTDPAAAVAATRDWIVSYPPLEEPGTGEPRRVA